MTASRIPFATLVSQLTDPDRDVRRKAIARIMRRRFEREQALSALVELSRDPDYQVFKAAIKAIVIINHTRVSSHILQLLMIATGSHPSVHRRVFMLKALAQVDYTQAIPYWLDALGDRSSLMRKAATTALKDARAFDPLVSLLCDPDPNLRLNAISGLRILGDMRVLDPLIAALSDPDEHVRLSAVLALGELGDTRALVPLRTLLVDPSVAKEAKHALAHLGASA